MNIIYYNFNNNDNKSDINLFIDNYNDNNIIIIHNKDNNNITHFLEKLPQEFDNFADITHNNLSMLYNTQKFKLIKFDNNNEYQVFIFNNDLIIISILTFSSSLFINILLNITNIKKYRIILISNFNKKKCNKINYTLNTTFNFDYMDNYYDYIYDNKNNIINIIQLNKNIILYQL